MTNKKQERLRIAPGEKPFSTLLRAFSVGDPMYDEELLSSAKQVDELVEAGLSALDKVPVEQHASFAAELVLQYMLTIFLQMQEITLDRLRTIETGLKTAELDDVLHVIDAMDSSIVAQCKSVIHNMKAALGDSSPSNYDAEASGVTFH